MSDHQQRPPAVEPEPLTRYRLRLDREPGAAIYEGTEPYKADRPQAVAKFIGLLTEEEPQEVMGCVMLDARNQAIGHLIAHRGTISRASVEPRQMLAAALLTNATGLVLFHNHPSGDPSPSIEDLAFTRRMETAGEVLGIKVLDHIVAGCDGRWVSLRQAGGWG